MIVVTAGTGDLAEIILATQNKCIGFGYDFRVYDLGGLGFGIKHDVPKEDLEPLDKGNNSMPPTRFKPELLIDSYHEGETVCWLDGDCLPLHPFEPAGQWDAAVTLRPTGEIGASGIRATDYLNAGVVWIRDLCFLMDWKRECQHCITDGDALNQVVAPDYNRHQWQAAMNGHITTPSNYFVRVLNAMEWNCWHLEHRDTAKILHFKRGIRNAAKGYV